MISAGETQIDGLKPSGAKVLIKVPRTNERTTDSGLFLPDGSDANRASVIGEVVSIGPGELTKGGAMRKADVEPGDSVLIEYHSWGSVYDISGEPHIVVDPHVIVGVLESAD